MKKGAKKNAADNLQSHKKIQGLIIAEPTDEMKFNYFLVPSPVEPPLEKSIQLLERSGVDDIFVFTSSNKEAVNDFISKRSKRMGSVVKVISSDECHNLGDILRAVFSMKVISNDFVMLPGNIVSEVDIKAMIQTYETVKSTQKNVLMIKAFNTIENNTPEAFISRNFVMMEKSSNAIVLYENYNPQEKRFKVKEHNRFKFKSLFNQEKPDEYDMLFNLVDCGLSICSLDVLNYFNENFDFHSERDDFLKDLLSSEISEDKIILYKLPSDIFFENIDNPYSLFRANLKIIKGCFDKFYINKEVYNISKFNRIIYKDAKINGNASIEDNVYIGENVTIGAGSAITDSIILSSCVIGDGCVIRNSYIGEKISIPNGYHLDHVIITAPVTLDNKYLSYKYLHDGKLNDWGKKAALNLDDDSYCLESDEENDADDNNFDSEVEETVAKLEENFEIAERVAMELINLKLAENKSFSQCVEAIFGDILKRVGNKEKEALKFIGYLTKWLPLLNKFIIGVPEMQRAVEVVEGYCRTNKTIGFHLIIQLLYKEEMLKEDVIIQWFDGKKESQDEFDAKNVKNMEKFVEWLQEEGESEEEDDEEEEEEEDD